MRSQRTVLLLFILLLARGWALAQGKRFGGDGRDDVDDIGFDDDEDIGDDGDQEEEYRPQHFFNEGDTVELWMSKIGPYHNPNEHYNYYTLPICKPEEDESLPKIKYAGFGEVLEGHGFVHSGMHVKFLEPIVDEPLCSTTLTASSAAVLRYAVQHHYWYQMYVDDLPLWGMLGENVAVLAANTGDEDANSGEESWKDLEALSFDLERKDADDDFDDDDDDDDAGAVGSTSTVFIYTRKFLNIAYNGHRIVEVNLTSENPVAIKEGTDLDFSFGVAWHKSDKLFENRFKRYLDHSFFEHHIHWFSIFNSFMMVLFLCGLVALILIRTLRSDYAKYMEDDDEDLAESDRGFGDDSGWKQIHGDVFRPPQQLVLFSSMTGAGAHLLTASFFVILISTFKAMHEERGASTTYMIVIYALTSVAGGYYGSSLYKQQFSPHPSPEWIKVMLVTACIVPVPVLTVLFCLNFITMTYGATTIPFSVGLTLVLIWTFVAVPLTVLGTLLGRRRANAEIPCRVNAFPRPLPASNPWYMKATAIVPLGGLLPFGCIFIEMWYIFTSFWNYKFYYVYGFLACVFVILTITTVCVTIVGMYFLLNTEDWRWWWNSFLLGGGVGAYVFLYSCYYFFAKTHMHGGLQIAVYFGYSALFSAAIFLACGTIGFMGARAFVFKIYRSVKVD
eukprot:g5452.t1